MLQLRPVTLIVLLLAPAMGASGVTAWFTSDYYARKIPRITEERQGYLALSATAVALSERAFIFARGYQETLDVCLTQLYRPTGIDLAAAKNIKKGGLGGPRTVREQSRLP